MIYRPILKIIGIFAPVIYMLTAAIGLVLNLSYVQMKYTFSDLMINGAPSKVLLTYLTSIYSVLTIIFAIGLFLFVLFYNKAGNNIWGIITAIFIFIVGFFTLIMGQFFPMDPNNELVTITGVIHLTLAYMISFSTISAVMFFVFWSKKVKLRDLSIYSLISLIVIFISGVIAISISRTANPLLGLFQRITIFAFLQWMAITAIWIINLKNIGLHEKCINLLDLVKDNTN